MAEEVNVNSFLVQCGAATDEEAATACRVLEEYGLGELLKRLISWDQTQIQQLSHTLDEVKSEREVLMLTSETKFHQLEKDLRVALQHLEKTESEKGLLEREAAERVAELTDLRAALKSAEVTRDGVVVLQNETQTAQQQLVNEKQELLETLERRNTEISRLNGRLVTSFHGCG
jgi:chromosome segregation ATPase